LELNNKILSDITVFNKYAKYDEDKGRRETWEELVTRNMTMHLAKYPEIEQEIRDAYDFVYNKQVLPSMRSLQFSGRPIELAHNRIYNCAYMPIDHIDAFSELMFLLLGGTGGGYSVQNRHVSQLPEVIGTCDEPRRFLVGDSIEGWADAIKVLVEAYFLGKQQPVFDVRDIRPKGAELITTGGKAPGPEPLKKCLEELEVLLKHHVGYKLTPLAAHDMCCIIADAVLAGGIRRAALISLFDRDDEEMLNCKSKQKVTVLAKEDFGATTEYVVRCEDRTVRELTIWHSDVDARENIQQGLVEWYNFFPYRARANNSATLPRGEVTQAEFMELMKRVEDSGSGEPGVYWSSNLDWGTNPCCEIGLRPFQFCNLCEINASDVTSQEDLNARARAAALIGTLQAGYTDFHYLRPIWKATTELDALIGVGMTGIGSGAVLNFDLREAADNVVSENQRIAFLLGINPAARTTTVKPSGTSSLVCGSASGIHAWHNDYYIRRMRLGKNEELYKYLKANIPALVEDDVFVPNGAVASFPQKAPEGSILRHETPAQLLDRVRTFNLDWVRHGHNNGDNTHNVSCTISVKDDEWLEIADWMWKNRNDYNGISVLPYNGGTYVQAPFEDISKEVFEELEKHLNDVDLSQVYEAENNTNLQAEAACGGGACEI
tara:strand:+ start:3857 stop:5842 length:1986 start_codon:yes stop_codon:yes gene_type:complete